MATITPTSSTTSTQTTPVTTLLSTSGASVSANLALSGLASGFDWQSIVSQLDQINRAPEQALQVQQTNLNNESAAVGNLITQLTTLQTDVQALKDPSLYTSQTATSSNTAVGTAVTDGTTQAGTYNFTFGQLATKGFQTGATNVANGVVQGAVATSSAAGFGIPVTTGTFTINGSVITIAATDTLTNIINNINAVTGTTNVTASYNAGTDKITLMGTGTTSIGSAGDTSNFLQATHLISGTSPVVSSSQLGGLTLSSTLSAATFSTALTNGAAGSFNVNGVNITYASTDTVSGIMARINASAANVNVTYDPIQDQFKMTSDTTGNLGLTISDVTGNLAAAMKLTTGAGAVLTNGLDLQYSVNGGTTLTSHSNTITSASSGIAGLTVNALSGSTSSSSVIQTTTDYGPSQPVNAFANGGAGGSNPFQISLASGNAGQGSGTGTQPGDTIQFAFPNGTPPTSTPQIQANTTYYVGRIANNNITIYTTLQDAINSVNGVGGGFVNAVNFGNVQNTSIAAAILPITGTTVTSTAGASSTSSTTITVAQDTTGVTKAVSQFVADYNSVQSLISAQTAVTSNSDGTQTLAILANDTVVNAVARDLRTKVLATMSGLSGTVLRMDSLGYSSTGFSDQITQTDTNALSAALAAHPLDVANFFSDPTNGLGKSLNDYLNSLISTTSVGTNASSGGGDLINHQTTLTGQANDITTQVATIEKNVQSEHDRMTAEFQAMETAQASINQQLTFLQQQKFS